MSFQRRGHFNS